MEYLAIKESEDMRRVIIGLKFLRWTQTRLQMTTHLADIASLANRQQASPHQLCEAVICQMSSKQIVDSI